MHSLFLLQIVNVLGFNLPQYKSPTLLLSLGLSVRVFWHLIMTRPDVIHVSSPGLLVFAGILYAKLLDLPLVVSYHTHVPGDQLPKYSMCHSGQCCMHMCHAPSLSASHFCVPLLPMCQFAAIACWCSNCLASIQAYCSTVSMLCACRLHT